MIMQDDRTVEQKKTHTWLVGGTDRFMSGWGLAEGGTSFAFWACLPKHARKVLAWVKSRGDITRVRTVARNYRPAGIGHCHIYTVNDRHPALTE